MEGFERIGLLANAHEFQRLAGDGANGRESCAATRITVHFGEDDAGDAKTRMKFAGGLYGILAGHGVGDEEDLGGVEGFLELVQFLHELLVDVLAAGGVDQ